MRNDIGKHSWHKKNRENFADIAGKFKFKVAMVAIAAKRSIAESARYCNFHPNLVGEWEHELIDIATCSSRSRPKATGSEKRIDSLRRSKKS